MSRDLVELFTLHLLGALDGDEAREASALAASPDDAVQRALAQAEHAVHAIAFAAPPVPPPADVRARLLARAAADSSRPTLGTGQQPDSGTPSPSTPRGEPPRGEPSGSRGAPGAARRPRTRWGVVALAVSFLVLAALQVTTVLSRRGRDDRERMLGESMNPKNARWTLASTDAANPRPMATAVIVEEQKWILVRGPGLPPLDTGQVYVLWGVPKDGSAPKNLAAFRGGNVGLDAVVVDALPASTWKALAISVEKNPRIDAPTRVVAAGGG